MNWWTHLLREERLAHTAPDTLSLDELVTLQATLLGKMMMVNGAIHRRYEEILTSFDEKPSSNEARDVLERAAEHLDALNHVLRDELALVLSERHRNGAR